MGIFDKAKDIAGKAKDKVDDVVEKNSDKIPDSIEKAYDKVSDAAEKVIPGEDTPESADAEETTES
ncbi:MAG: antitoxin [Actinomycetota bacterium]